jgi:opacity protein-like surface antigen
MLRLLRRPSILIGVVMIIGMTSTAHAQDSRSTTSIARPQPSGIGLDIFGGAGASWPDATESFKAVELGSTLIDFSAGARVTGLWSGMFVQFSGARWRDTGERAFVDSDGTAFPLGIPLDVKATFMDGTLGFKRAMTEAGIPYFLYLGGGAGVVRYSESSPFAEAGENLEVTEVSYHALAGVEIPIVQRLAAVVETRYRYIPNLLGDGGVSAVFGDDSFGGFNATVGLRIGFGGPSLSRRPSAPPSKTDSVRADVPLPTQSSSEGFILEAAPVYIHPDTSRIPLKILEVGTRVKILQQRGDWQEIQFPDRQWGPRVGWIQRRFVRLIDK